MVAARPQITPNVLYEPRALWEVRSVDSDDLTGGGPWIVPLDSRRWRNGRRHTLILTHLLLDAPSYLLRRNDPAQVAAATTFRNAQSILGTLKVQVQAPFRSWFSSKPYLATGFSQVGGRANPPMDFTDSPYASSLFGLTRWDFRDTCPAPFWIPKDSSARFDMSGFTAPNVGGDFTDTVFATAFFDEVPMAGYALREPGTGRMSEQRFTVLPTNDTDVYPVGPNPFPADQWGANAIANGANQMFFHHVFSSRNWRGDEAIRGVTHKELRGFSFAIDQIDYDESLQAAPDAGVAGQEVTPIASRVGTRVRMNAGGSGEWWWDPGCPLSLVSPSLGPAQVYKFHEPIKLAHGEALDVSVELPQTILSGQEVRLPREFIFGVSMVGYAIVEG